LIEVLLMSESPTQMLQPTAGAMLRQARESAGLHIAALSVALKVPVKKLEALEADRIDLLPDAVFARALASSMCRALKIDPSRILASLPQLAPPSLNSDGRSINATFRSPDQASGRTIKEQLSKPLVLLILAIAVGTLSLMFFPSAENAGKTEPSEITATAKAASSSDVTRNSQNPPAESIRTEESARSVSGVGSLGGGISGDERSGANQPLSGQLPGADSASASLSPSPSAQVAMVGSATTNGILVLKTKGTAWAEVTDASGVVQLRKIMAEGETVGVSGALPLRVILGRADATEVQIRGKSFELVAVSKDNVARFEVK
jgi:cytoskeleton protein RodZ